MQVRTSTDWPRARGSGRRTTSRKVTRVSPLGRDFSSAGAETRPRSTTSFRSITATLMTAASPGDGAPRRGGGQGLPPRGGGRVVDGGEQVGVGRGQPPGALVSEVDAGGLRSSA